MNPMIGRPRTGKGHRVGRVAGWVVLLIYAGLHAFPAILFTHHVSAENVTLYQRSPVSPAAVQRIAEAVNLTRRSELFTPDANYRVFLCNNRALFRFFGLFHGSSYAFSLPLTNHIFVAEADLERNFARSAAKEYNRRTFAGVLAHEITHVMIRHSLGVVSAMRLPSWIAEGYSDYLAQESSVPEEEGIPSLLEEKGKSSPAFNYFVWRKMVQHLMDDEHLTFAQLIERAGDFESVRRETIAALR